MLPRPRLRGTWATSRWASWRLHQPARRRSFGNQAICCAIDHAAQRKAGLEPHLQGVLIELNPRRAGLGRDDAPVASGEDQRVRVLSSPRPVPHVGRGRVSLCTRFTFRQGRAPAARGFGPRLRATLTFALKRTLNGTFPADVPPHRDQPLSHRIGGPPDISGRSCGARGTAVASKVKRLWRLMKAPSAIRGHGPSKPEQDRPVSHRNNRLHRWRTGDQQRANRAPISRLPSSPSVVAVAHTPAAAHQTHSSTRTSGDLFEGWPRRSQMPRIDVCARVPEPRVDDRAADVMALSAGRVPCRARALSPINASLLARPRCHPRRNQRRAHGGHDYHHSPRTPGPADKHDRKAS